MTNTFVDNRHRTFVTQLSSLGAGRSRDRTIDANNRSVCKCCLHFICRAESATKVNACRLKHEDYVEGCNFLIVNYTDDNHFTLSALDNCRSIQRMLSNLSSMEIWGIPRPTCNVRS